MKPTGVEHAVLHLLCFGTQTYDRVADYPGRNGVGGLFSQLHFLAQQVLERLYQGHTPAPTWHATVRLHGYGEGTLSDYFRPIPCPPLPPMTSLDDALATLVRAPRHQVVSHLLHALYTPRSLPSSMAKSPLAEVDLAMHVRRGDKITEQRPGERIIIWDEEALVQEAKKHIGAGRQGTILVASDDDAFSRSVQRALENVGHAVIRHGNEQQKFDAQNRSVEAALVCSAACVAPLLSLVQQFSRARTLMISTKSNLGSFLLSWWFAANERNGAVMGKAGGAGDVMPGFVDLDRVVTSTATFSKQGRYFCVLPWGSRRGMCKSNQSTCDLPAFAQRSFCSPAGANRAGNAGGAKGKGVKAKGKGAGSLAEQSPSR